MCSACGCATPLCRCSAAHASLCVAAVASLRADAFAVRCVVVCCVGGVQDDWTPLHCAAVWGHASVVTLLLERGADIKAKDNVRRTHAAIAATACGTVMCARLLASAAALWL